MAYAAVVSLIQILDDVLQSQPGQHPIPNKKQEIESLLENMSFLHDFLVDSSKKRMRDAHLETKIRDAAYKAEDLIEFRMSEYSTWNDAAYKAEDRMDYRISGYCTLKDAAYKAQDLIEFRISEYSTLKDAACKAEDLIEFRISGYSTLKNAACKTEDLIESWISEYSPWKEWIPWYFRRRDKFCIELKVVTEEIDSIKQQVIGLRDTWDANDRHQTQSSRSTISSTHDSSSDDTMVGYDNDYEQIKEQLVKQQSKLKVIPIIGMGGIGKTTLAKKLYHDKCIEEHFPLRVWVTVSQNYVEREILLSLLKFMTEHSYENSQESDDKLLDRIHRCLRTHIYLIVMDDVWHTEVWDLVRNIFPDDSNGSRILLTTRLDEVAAYVNSHHHKMHLLNHAESWNLLRHKVFGRKSCPTELEGVGKKIARSCKGLPFTIVVISGHLSKLPTEISEWERVAEDVKSQLVSNDTQWVEMLSLSYDYLPPYLRASFLYMGVFPEDLEVPVSKLVKLWIAEGFLKPTASKSLEEMAEEYLTDLISRNLVLIGDKRSSGSIKTCKVHSLTREFCLIKAEEEKFLHSTDTNAPSFPLGIKDPRRLNCRGDILCKAIPEIFNACAPLRSLLSQDKHRFNESVNGSLQVCKLLRVMDLAKVHMQSFPRDILKLVHLRYVSLCCAQEELRIPKKLPDSLCNLQTLIISKSSDQNMIGKGGSKVYLPVEIWRMSQLRHLHFKKCYLPCPTGDKNYSLLLTNLLTLSKMSSCNCTEDLFKRTPSLRKLGIKVEESGSDVPFSLGNVVNLPQLEMLKIIVEPGSNVHIPRNYTLPPKLKKLTLTDTKFHWRDMSIVVSLPNLEELELIDNAFIGPEWQPENGDQFLKLKSLRIDRTDLQYWEANSVHFPLLECIILWECDKLKEFPGPNDIHTLKMIELDDASPSAVAKAREMQREQWEDYGYEGFQVYFYWVWNNDYQKRKEEGETYKRRKEAQDKERKRREEEQLKYSGYHPGFNCQSHLSTMDDFNSRSPFSTTSSSRDWMHESKINVRFNGGLGSGFGGGIEI